MRISHISRSELLVAELVIFIAIALQLSVRNISHELTYGPQYLLISTEIALAVSIGLTASRGIGKLMNFQRNASILLLALISLANISSFFLVARSLILNLSVITGYELLVSAIAIFITNIIIFALWYWEIDSPGLTGHTWSKNDKDFHFPQHDLKNDFPDWQPKFIDYLYLSITNAINFASADTKPLTSQAKTLMGVQALISVFTLALIVARSVSILG